MKIMKRVFVLPALMIILVMVGCSVTKIDSPLSEVKYEDKDGPEAPKQDYSVSQQENIARVSVVNTGGSSSDVEITFNRTSNANVPFNFRFQGSSGSIMNTPLFQGFKDVEFPFTGTVEYNIKPRLSTNDVSVSKTFGSANNNSSSDVRCRLTFTVNEPGDWSVRISN